MGAYRHKLPSFSDGHGCWVVMWNGVMGDLEWNLSQWFVVVVEGDGEENSYTGYSSGELIASAPQPVKNIKYSVPS